MFADALTLVFFFFNDPAPPEIYTLSLHDALPIYTRTSSASAEPMSPLPLFPTPRTPRSEEHTSELQSRRDLVCRLLLEKKNTRKRSKARGAARSGSGCVRSEASPLPREEVYDADP